MSSLINVLGFFYVEGSKDFPNNMGLDSKFGFDVDPDTGDLIVDPVFNYSINDVERAFSIPRNITRPSAYQINTDDSVKEVSNLLVESDNNPAIITEDGASVAWGAVFKVLEALYMHQSTVSNPSSGDYESYGDEILADSGSTYYVDKYKKGSLSVEVSSISSVTTRLDRVNFIVDMGTVETPQNVTFTVYLVADTFVETLGSGDLSVYLYEDSNGDDVINNTEFENDIVSKLFTLMKEKNFKQYKTYPVEKHEPDGQGGETIIPQVFYVFSTYAPSYVITTDKLKNAVKAYLVDKYSSDYQQLGTLYPDLFASDIVHVHPLTGNTRTVGMEEVIVSPLDLTTLHNYLQNRGYEIDPLESGGGLVAYPTEIFHLGAENGDSLNENNIIAPILAIEETNVIGHYPITSRYPGYKPVFSTGFVVDENNTWKTFHHFILIAVKSVVRAIPLTQGEIEALPNYESLGWETVMKTEAPANIDYVKFTFEGCNYYVHAPAAV